MTLSFLAASVGWTESVGAITALLGVGFALWQMRENYNQREREQRWKRSEFVAEEMRILFESRAVQTALWLLDYSAIYLMPDGARSRQWASEERAEGMAEGAAEGAGVGEGARKANAMTEDAHDPTVWNDGSYLITDRVIVSSLRDHRKFKDQTERFNAREMLCREALDAWLTGLETLDHHIPSGLIEASDLKPYLGYWVEKMGDPRTEWKDPEFYVAFAQFIEAYEYRGVQDLCSRLGTPIHPSVVEARVEQLPSAAARRVEG